MPIPILKVGITVVRLFSRPFVTVLTRRMVNNPTSSERTFFRWFGHKCYYYDSRLDAIIAQQSLNEGLKYVPIDLEKVSDGAAIQKGIEYFCELVFFYGLLMALAIYEMNKRHREAAKTLEQVKGMENKQKRLDTVLGDLRKE